MEGCIHSVLDTQIEDEDPLACVTLHIHEFSIRAPKVIVTALLSLSLQLTGTCRDSAAEMGPHPENTNGYCKDKSHRQVSSQVPPWMWSREECIPSLPAPSTNTIAEQIREVLIVRLVLLKIQHVK